MRPPFTAVVVWASAALLAAGCTPSVKPGFHGNFKVSFQELYYADLYYPSAGNSQIDPGAAPCPVIVLIPGYLETPLFYRSYGEQAASWGYVVLIADFFWQFDEQAVEDTLKLIQLLNEMNQAGEFAGMLDMTRLGLAGHSLGGKYALAATLDDPSIGAVVAIDPVDGCAQLLPLPDAFGSFTPELMPQVKVPTCILGAEYASTLNPVSENYHEFFRYATCPAEEVLVYKSDHASFVDDYAGLFQKIHDWLLQAKPTDDNRAKNVAARYMISWFDVHLRGQKGFWTYLTGDDADADVKAGSVRITTNF